MGTSAAWLGDRAFVFGGYDGTNRLAEILEFNPATNVVTTLPSAALPSPRYYTTAVSTGSVAYIFGGEVGGATGEILRFDPAGPTRPTTKTVGTLPSPRFGAGAVWTGEFTYLFGGWTGGPSGAALDEVVRFDPVTNQATLLPNRLPYALSHAAATWDGQYAYVYGGRGNNDVFFDGILRFNPSNGSVEIMPEVLPSVRAGTSAVGDGIRSYLFGGAVGTGAYLDDIAKHVGGTGQVVTLPERLPSPRDLTSAVWSGTTAYIFGGWNGTTALDDVIAFVPDVMAPAIICSLPLMPIEATGPGGTSVSWKCSAEDIVDGPVPVDCNPPSDGVFPLGSSGVICTATDSSGNTARIEFDIVVVDSTAPLIVCDLPAFPAEATGAGGAAIVWGCSASDTVDGDVPVECTPPSGSTFAIDSTSVLCTATDSSGNVATFEFDVVVIDSTPPDLAILLGGDKRITDPPTYKGPVTVTLECSDIVGPCSIVYSLDGDEATNYDGPFTVEGRGEYEVCATALDAYNNTANDCRSFRIAVAPGPPQNVFAMPGLDGGAHVTWDPPADDGGAPVTGYRIYKSCVFLNGHPLFLIHEQGPNERSFDDPRVGGPGSLCTYHVAARNAIGDGPMVASNPVPGTTF